MERTLSIEDRIRKAEEIYYKRKNSGVKIETEGISTNKNSQPNLYIKRKLKKLFIQISVCIIIYIIMYSTDFGAAVFKNDTANYIKNLLATDIDFYELYQNMNTYLQSIIPETDEQNNVNNIDDKENEVTNSVDENTVTNNQEVTDNELNTTINNEIDIEDAGVDKTEIENSEENIGGAVEVKEDSIENNSPDEQKSQMQIDAEYILSKVNFIKPLENYQITSRYGLRNPTTSTVPKNHTGIDLAVEIGTKIVSATNGTVIIASSQGDYGNHIKIQIDDIIIVYAHCNKLYVGEGQQIVQGQEIAEVGTSGNSTGPHLHFEVRLNESVIDPEYILDFS